MTEAVSWSHVLARRCAAPRGTFVNIEKEFSMGSRGAAGEHRTVPDD
jgi:hypothetical protein